MREEIKKWRSQSGLDYFVKPSEDPLKRAIDLSVNIDNINLSEIDEALLVLSNYHNYLSSQAGIIAARVLYLEDSFNEKVDRKASRYTANSTGERRAIALSRDNELQFLKGMLTKEQSKQLMLKPIVDSVRLKIDSLKKIYDRRSRINVNA